MNSGATQTPMRSPGANVFESVVDYTTFSGASDLIGGTGSPE